jgi:hypothetical protein
MVGEILGNCRQIWHSGQASRAVFEQGVSFEAARMQIAREILAMMGALEVLLGSN